MVKERQNKIIKNCVCKKCGHFWKAQIIKPQQCPRCKRYDWDISLKQLKEKDLKNEK